MLFFLKNFLFIKESWKSIFEHQISILELFLKDHVTLKTALMQKI